MIQTTCPFCRSAVAVTVGAVVLGRRLPAGDGTASYLCLACGRVVSQELTCEDVMTAVFAGAHAFDVTSVP